MNSIFSRGQRLAFNESGRAEFNGGVFVRARTPDLPERHEAAPNFSPVHERAMITNADVGHAKTLANGGLLARFRKGKIGLGQNVGGESEAE